MELVKIVNNVGRELSTVNSEPHRKVKLALDNEERMYVALFEEGISCDKMTNLELEKKLAEFIAKAVNVLGYKKTGFDITSECGMLMDDIRKDFPKAKIPEIETAFNTGARGMYGEFMGLSVATYYKWLKSFFESEKRKETLKRYLDMKEAEQSIEPTDEQKEKIFADAYASDLEKIKSGLDVSPTHVMYDYCDRKGLITLNAQRKLELAAKLKSNLESLVETSEREYAKYLKGILEDRNLFAQECKKEAYINHLKQKCNV